MKRHLIALLAAGLLSACEAPQEQHAHEAIAAEEFERGPHGGRLLRDADRAVELNILEAGVPPEYRVWLYEDDRPVPPTSATVRVRLARLGGEINEFQFAPAGDFLRGDGEVAEPHSFDVRVEAAWNNGKASKWEFASYEGRTTISREMAQSMGVATSIATAATIQDQLLLSGVIQADPARISQVRARYPGVLREVPVQPWSTVERGAVLAQVQSNESLQNYSVTAPIGGVLIEHSAQVGEATGEQALFTIVDLSRVWIELDVFQRDLQRVAANQQVEVMDLEGSMLARGHIARVAPLAIHGSQSVRARVVIDNASGSLRPGQFVTGRVTVAKHVVPLAVEKSALQRFRDFDVVFEQVGDIYEVRMLELGRADERYVEVVGGLKPDTRYVTANSYLIKADIEKAGASHDH